jgi:hypothetical protein
MPRLLLARPAGERIPCQSERILRHSERSEESFATEFTLSIKVLGNRYFASLSTTAFRSARQCGVMVSVHLVILSAAKNLSPLNSHYQSKSSEIGTSLRSVRQCGVKSKLYFFKSCGPLPWRALGRGFLLLRHP